MKKYGKFVIAAIISIFAFGAANAQDLAQVAEKYNTAAAALQEGKNAEALAGFQSVLTEATALGEDGKELAGHCKEYIPKILLQMGKEAVNTKNYTEAIAKLKEATAKGTEYGQASLAQEATALIPQIYIAEGSDALNAQDVTKAIAKYKEAIALDGNNGKAYYFLGLAYDQANNNDEAIKALTKASELGEKESANDQLGKIFLIKANNALKVKNFTEAISNATKSNSYVESSQADKILGIAAFNAKKYDQAIPALEKVIATDSKALDMKFYLARAYEAKGNKAKACTYYKASAADPRFKAFCTAKISTLCK